MKHMKILLLSAALTFTLLGVRTVTSSIVQTPLQNVSKDKNTSVTYVVFGDNGEIEQLYSYPAYQADR